MAKTIRFENSQFDAREAEKITGVPLVTQRDWRRRGLLLNKTDISGRAIYEPAEIIELMILNALVSMGVGVSVAKNACGMARLPVEALIEPERVISTSGARRFLVIIGDDVSRTATSSGIETVMRETSSYAAIVLDLREMVEKLRKGTPRPITRKIVSDK